MNPPVDAPTSTARRPAHVDRERVERGRELVAAARHERVAVARRATTIGFAARRPGGPAVVAGAPPTEHPARVDRLDRPRPARHEPAPHELDVEAPPHQRPSAPPSARRLRGARPSSPSWRGFLAAAFFLAGPALLRLARSPCVQPRARARSRSALGREAERAELALHLVAARPCAARRCGAGSSRRARRPRRHLVAGELTLRDEVGRDARGPASGAAR